MIGDEHVLSFGEAAKMLPTFNGRRIHTSTLWRWATKGINGTRLETRRIGRRYVTSAEALDRFTEALAEANHPQPRCTIIDTDAPTTRQREKQIEHAETTLQAAGIL